MWKPLKGWKKRQGVKKKDVERERENELNREMRFRGPGAQREREGRHRKDSCRNNICSCLHVSAPLVRGIWEKKCIFIAYKNFMNTKECHRQSRRTRHGDRETDVGDHRERWRLPWRCLRQLAVHWNAVEPCLKDDVLQCQLEHVTSCQCLLGSQWPGIIG